jgi:hypothetical protein
MASAWRFDFAAPRFSVLVAAGLLLTWFAWLAFCSTAAPLVFGWPWLLAKRRARGFVCPSCATRRFTSPQGYLPACAGQTGY